MRELYFDKKIGFGKCVTDSGIKLAILRTKGVNGEEYSLNAKRPEDRYDYWIKENVKRISTIQRYLDRNNYNVIIVEL